MITTIDIIKDEKQAITRKMFGVSDFLIELEENPAFLKSERSVSNYQRIYFGENLVLEISRKAKDFSFSFWKVRRNNADHWVLLRNNDEVKDCISYEMLDSPKLSDDEKYGLILILSML